MGQVCHQHCPGGGSSVAAVAGVVATGSAASAIGAYLGDIVLTAGVIVAVLVVTGTWFLVHVLRRDREHVSGRLAVSRAAGLAAGSLRQIEAPPPVVASALALRKEGEVWQ